MYPNIQELVVITIPPEKYVSACDLSQLYELRLLTDKKIKQLEDEIQQADPDKDNYLDNANKNHQIIKKLQDGK
jgi:hypothetical protein